MLWALGLVTALLTAFYMSRQVFMVFFGDPRWNDPVRTDDEEHLGEEESAESAVGEDEHDEHGDFEPHESPWTMTVPLVLLAIPTFIAGLINTPFSDETKLFENWLEPVVHEAEAHLTLSGTTQVVLAVIATLAAVTGAAVAYFVYLRKRLPVVEPEVLAHGWYIDETMAKVVDGPGEAAFEATATFDRVVIDGAVNGTGAVVKDAGSRLRVLQTGYVRNYALGIALGTVALLIYVVIPDRPVSSDFGFPVLSVLVLLPAAGALFVACLPRAREELVKGTAVAQLGRRRRRRGLDAGRVPDWATPASSSSTTRVDRRPRDLVAPGRRRHLAVPRRPDPGPVPDRPAGDRPGPRRQAVLRLAAAARGGVPRARSSPSTSSSSS